VVPARAAVGAGRRPERPWEREDDLAYAARVADDDPDPGWLRIAPGCAVRLDEVRWRFAASGGPGGQHANKAATRAEARFDVAASPSLTDSQRERLVARLGPVVTVIVDETRSQNRNRGLALERLRSRLAAGLVRERPRRPTKPSKGSVERRLAAKRQRADTKKHRSGRPSHDD
jgi:ribosome-associated protein